MKHEPFLSEPEAAAQGDLQLRLVLGRGADGLPVLAEPAPGALLVLSDLPQAAAGLVAVCRDIPGRTVVLGYVTAAQAARAGLAQGGADAEGWVSIGCGKAQIRLHPDGRMRLKAQDITIDSAGRMGLRGAWIDLN
ncbi:hypothetical protein [Paracoccus aminovorans]|uniref:hypothetical protein n=1 Tax=Paracoccus aminovorans TaxID=34004 RepID=UPI002B262606|nr:hypothetical protein [Paracoccus aminovorans]